MIWAFFAPFLGCTLYSLADLDRDGFPLPADCDDQDPEVHPGAFERCDASDRDEDCDGGADDDDPEGPMANADYLADDDGDGHGNADRLSCLSGVLPSVSADCDDTDPTVHPGGVEVCDALHSDEDCDGFADDDDDSVADPVLWHANADSDGFGDPDGAFSACDSPPGWVADGTDCDDADPQVGGPVSSWPDGDGDGYGTGDPDAPESTECLPNLGWADNALDCDDASASVHPGAREWANNGVDDDCDGDSRVRNEPAAPERLEAADLAHDGTWAEFGASIAASDLDGDGRAELVVGALEDVCPLVPGDWLALVVSAGICTDNAGEPRTGALYVRSGGPILSGAVASPDFRASGPESSDFTPTVGSGLAIVGSRIGVTTPASDSNPAAAFYVVEGADFATWSGALVPTQTLTFPTVAAILPNPVAASGDGGFLVGVPNLSHTWSLYESSDECPELGDGSEETDQGSGAVFRVDAEGALLPTWYGTAGRSLGNTLDSGGDVAGIGAEPTALVGSTGKGGLWLVDTAWVETKEPCVTDDGQLFDAVESGRADYLPAPTLPVGWSFLGDAHAGWPWAASAGWGLVGDAVDDPSAHPDFLVAVTGACRDSAGCDDSAPESWIPAHGAVALFAGGSDFDEVPDGWLLGEASMPYAGVQVSTADIDGDGVSDVAVRACVPWDSAGLLGDRVYLFRGPLPVGEIELAWADTILEPGGGCAAAKGLAAGDFDGDGTLDIAVASPNQRTSQGYPDGVVQLYAGPFF